MTQLMQNRQPLETVEWKPSPLSKRETEILDCIVHGYSNKQIATKMNISEQTVKNHVWNTLQKLGVPDRTQATLMAVSYGWVSPWLADKNGTNREMK